MKRRRFKDILERYKWEDFEIGAITKTLYSCGKIKKVPPAKKTVDSYKLLQILNHEPFELRESSLKLVVAKDNSFEKAWRCHYL